ncbi:hypothetical protein ACROYT_G020194 [Oculina patagonica]
MAYLRIFIAVWLFFSLSSKKSAVQYPVYTDVYVSLSGHDSESCGTVSHPCRSIAKAVHQVDRVGHIHLDGTGTERNPYVCHLGMTHEQQPGIVVQKSLEIEGWKDTPLISCVNGFHFIKESTAPALNITLSGIVFRQTPLMFQDCEILTVTNCSFEDTSIALSILIRNNVQMSLNIQRCSFFKNNTSCVEITLRSGALIKGQFLTININGTTFLENGFHKRRFAGGVMTIQSETTLPSSTHVQISCFNVTSVKNYGHFVNLELPSAVTSEVYNDVRLFNNTISDFVNAKASRKARHLVNSLYNSNTKKTRVEFSNLRCSHNNLSRCIKIHSEEAQVEIHNSSFIGQELPNERGGAMFFNSTVLGSVVIFNSRFHRNIARSGGALYVHSNIVTLSLNITNVNFTECAAGSGCAVLVEDEKSGKMEKSTRKNKLIAIFRGIRVRGCFGFHGLCDGIRLMLFNGKVIISDSSWENNTKSIGYALTVVTTGDNTDVTISGCTFVRNNVQIAVVAVVSNSQRAGTLTIVDSSVSGQEKRGNVTLLTIPGIFASSEFYINLTNIVLTLHFYGLMIGGLSPNTYSEAYPLNVSIYNCTFLDNVRDIDASSPEPTQVKFAIKNTIFKFTNREAVPNSFGISIYIEPLKILNFSKAIVELDNVTFDSKPCNVVGLLFPGNKTIRIKRSSFIDGLCFDRYYWYNISMFSVYQISSGAVSVISSSDEKLSPGCVNEETTKDVHPRWHYQTRVTFEDTLFEGNGGLITGAAYICNGHTAFKRCRFRNNFAVENSGHVYSAYGTGQVDFKDCIFISTKVNMTRNGITFQKSTFMQSESGGPINLQNTTMVSFAADRISFSVLDISNGGYVHMDDNSSIQCPIGSHLFLDNTTHFVYTEQRNSFCRINVTVLKYSCQFCSPGFYSIQNGVSRGFIVNNTVKCLQCPFGASCIERNIAAKPNFWGYPTSSDPPSLKFMACPEQYCREPTSDTQVHNSCQGNRMGTLCGKCNRGYSETLFSSECRKNEECDNYWFWIWTILITTGLALYLLIKPPILGFLANQILWFRRKEEDHEKDDLGGFHQHSGADNGYIKITFYFYQVAELLMVGSIESLLEKLPFIYTVIAAFNFQVRTINHGIGCPFPGMTAVSKQLVLSGTVFMTMTDIVLIYCVHCVFNTLRRKEKPALIHYMAVVMEVLLLGYERLAETSLKLMQCVSIGSTKRLFIDGNVPCMQWWQYVLLAYIAVFVVPFIIVLYCGSSKLYSASITASEFLAACMLPLPFLIYWFFKKIQKQTGQISTRAQFVNKDILEVLHGPFRPPNNEDKGTLYWESVLIGRRFILLACHSFIRSSMLRMVSMAAACLLMTIHHVLKKPFREPLANKAETLSLTALTMIALINLTKATLMSFGITIDGPYQSYLDALEWFEVCALAFVPVLVSGFVTFAILSQLARLLGFLIKQITGCSRQLGSPQWLMDQRRPLLDITEYKSDAPF